MKRKRRRFHSLWAKASFSMSVKSLEAKAVYHMLRIFGACGFILALISRRVRLVTVCDRIQCLLLRTFIFRFHFPTFATMRKPRLRSRDVPWGLNPSETCTREGSLFAIRVGQILHVAASYPVPSSP